MAHTLEKDMACWVERGRACNLAAVAGKGFGPAEDRALRRMGWLPVGRRRMGWALLGHLLGHLLGQ